MTDQERHEIGICYKQKGNAKAVELGHKLVSGDIKSSRVNACVEFIQNNPNTHIYCFRGGQRSEIMQSWISEAGVEIPRLEGGYKAFRSYLMETTTSIATEQNIIILAGRTGSGKTIVLNKLSNSVDLEGLAHHRGSSFGRFSTPQPTQVSFENSLAYDLIAHQDAGFTNLVLEDESKNIGRCFIPNDMYKQMEGSDVVLLERSAQERIEIIYDEYVLASQAEHLHNFPTEPDLWINQMSSSFERISRRLGGKRTTELNQILDSAWKHQVSRGDPTRHMEWIEHLLKEYYDPMYDYQIDNKSQRIVFSGNEEEMIEYLTHMGTKDSGD